MKWNRTDLILVLIGLIPAILSLVMYNRLPDQMGTHFGPSSQVNEYMDRPAAIAMLAFLGVVVPLLTKIGRKIDPSKHNFAKFEGAFSVFRWVITLFMCFVGLFLVGYNLGYNLSPKLVTSLGLGLLIIVLGNFMGQIRFNYSYGIKTPWTLSNETVWRKTHRMAGPVWVAGGIGILLSAFAPGAWGSTLMLAMIAIIALVPAAYSYLVHRGMNR